MKTFPIQGARCEVSDEWLETVAHSPEGARAAAGVLQRTLTLGPAHRDLAIVVDHRAGELHHGRNPPARGEVDLAAQFDQPLTVGLLVRGDRGVRAHPSCVAVVGDEPHVARLTSGPPIVRHDALLMVLSVWAVMGEIGRDDDWRIIYR